MIHGWERSPTISTATTLPLSDRSSFSNDSLASLPAGHAEEYPEPTMPAWKSPPGGVSRSKTTAHHSIRGRISSPIPMPSPLEEEDFPVQKPAPAAAPAPPEGKEAGQQRQLQPPQAGASATPSVSGSRTNVPPPTSSASEPPSGPHPAPATGPSPTDGRSSGAGGSQNSPRRHRANPSSTLRYSMVSAASTDNTGQAGNRTERKKSALRGALSKLFGRKKKGGQGSVPTDRMSALTAAQHRSDMSPLNRTRKLESKRSASLPITEFDRALRSHSLGPEDVMAIENARESLQADRSPNRRRAATLTSRTFLGPRRGEFGEWSGLSPRPASSQGRGSRLGHLADDPDQIGRAITRDSAGERAHRRRSRSLSQLQDALDSRPTTRRRSDEIRYWRQSYDPVFLSPLFSDAPGAGDEEAQGHDGAGQASAGPSEFAALDRPPKTPPQPFMFGSVASMNEMAGMKITKAASIDVRLHDLEAQMQAVTRVVNQLCHAVPGSPGVLAEFRPAAASGPASGPPAMFSGEAPPRAPAVYQTITYGSRYSSSRHSLDTDARSQTSFGEGQTYIGSLHPPSSSATNVQTLKAAPRPAQEQAPAPAAAAAAAAERPLSTATLRGAASMPALAAARDDGAAEPSGAALLAQLEAERAARQALEAQVKKLSHRLNTLSTTMFAMVRDPSKARSREPLAPPAVPAVPAAAQPARPAGVPPAAAAAAPPRAHSVFEQDDEDEEPGPARAPSCRDDEDDDDFQTPAEEPFPRSYGAFGEELRAGDDETGGAGAGDKDPGRRKAARTLSLSQLTLGRGVPLRI